MGSWTVLRWSATQSYFVALLLIRAVSISHNVIELQKLQDKCSTRRYADCRKCHSSSTIRSLMRCKKNSAVSCPEVRGAIPPCVALCMSSFSKLRPAVHLEVLPHSLLLLVCMGIHVSVLLQPEPEGLPFNAGTSSPTTQF